jgi:uncharacterized membrane protein (UPF0127 family)
MNRNVWLAAAAVVAIIAALYIFLATPVATSADGRAMRLPTDPDRLVVLTASGERTFTIEIADDNSERPKGLMFRETMADDHGMLFVFERTGPVSFWMKNTPMPLDIVFIGEDGRIIDILPGQPFSEAGITPGRHSRFVLELKQGTADRAGIRSGDQVRHPVIDQVASSRPRGG